MGKGTSKDFRGLKCPLVRRCSASEKLPVNNFCEKNIMLSPALVSEQELFYIKLSGILKLGEELFFVVLASLGCVTFPELSNCRGPLQQEALSIPGQWTGPMVSAEVAFLLDVDESLVR